MPIPRYDHIFLIIEENHSYSQIIGSADAPVINRLASTYGLATAYYATSHPSEPNYVALLGGSDFGIKDDGPYQTNRVDAPCLANQLEAAGLSWKSYQQSLPSPGFAGNSWPAGAATSLYVSRHNGFLNFASVQDSPSEMQRSVPIEQLTADLANGAAPSFGLVVPDLCHDMHGNDDCPDDATNVKAADTYLGSLVQGITSSAAWNAGPNAIVVTWDEGTDNAGCCDADPGGGQVPAIVITSHGPRGIRYSQPCNHYSLLLTVQQAFGLGCLQHTCDSANVKPMSPLLATR